MALYRVQGNGKAPAGLQAGDEVVTGGGRKGRAGPAEGGAGSGEGQAEKALVFPCQRQRRKARQNGARHGAPR